MVLQRELIRAKDRIDEELRRFGAIQTYIADAIAAETEEAFATLTLEAVIATFEFEVAAFFLAAESENQLQVLGEFGFETAPGFVAYAPGSIAECRIANRDDAAGAGFLDAWPELGLDQAILGGITVDSSGFYDPITADHHSAFSVLVQQAGSLWNTRQLNAEVKRQNQRLQAEVARYLVTQRELTGTKNQVDEELMRFKAIQNFIAGALGAEEEADFFDLTLEAAVEAFEFEVALFARFDETESALIVAAAFGFEAPPERLKYDRQWFASAESRILTANDAILRAWSALNLEQAILCPISDKDGQFTGFILGGITTDSTDFFDPLSEEQGSAFTVLVRQAGALWVNRQLNDEIRRHNAELIDLTTSYSRFVPFAFLELLDKSSIQEIAAGDNASLHMSVLVLDIRGFTALTERLGPTDTFSWLNEFLAVTEPIIAAENGFINQYQGDAIMALFPGAAAALRCAAQIMSAARTFNQAQEDRGRMPINFGIGVNSGPLMLGAIGAANRLDSNVVGDTANLAARTEGLTKQYGTAAIFTEFTHDALEAADRFRTRELDTVTVKGRAGPVTIYELLDQDQPQADDFEALSSFAEGLQAYRNGDFKAALTAFEQASDRDPDDQPTALFRKRCADFIAQPPGDDWDGISAIDEK